MRPLTSALCLSLIWVALPAAASVFKCAADKGEVVYQDVPCGAGRELRNFDTDPPAITVLPSTPVAAAPGAAASTLPPPVGCTCQGDAACVHTSA